MLNSLKVLSIIKKFPGINTRYLIDTLSTVCDVSPNKICGYLSWLKRSGQITIVTFIPNQFSIAY